MLSKHHIGPASIHKCATFNEKPFNIENHEVEHEHDGIEKLSRVTMKASHTHTHYSRINRFKRGNQ